MTTDTPCPELQELRQFLLGLPGSVRLEEHFGRCPRCLLQAAELKTTDDPLAEAVLGGSAGHSVEIPEEVLKRLRELGREGSDHEVVMAGGRIGSYRVDRALGHGGMGSVYLARHDQLTRPVAVKVLSAGASAERVARFRREAEVVATLRHPGVVQVYEVGEADGCPFLAMEYVPGGTLAARLVTAPLPPVDAARVVAAAARAIAHAHARGVVHRDLKPSNVLLGADGTPKVADFGLARYREDVAGTQVQTQTGAVLGTPAYMAPEQAAGGKEVGPAADVYGLGAVLYECLTGRPPFKAATVLETLDQVRRADPVPVRRLQPGVPRDLETVCLKCLEKNPGRRYPSATAVADDLDRFLRGEPVTARPVGSVVRVMKWARRRPVVAALVACCVLFAVALAAVVTVYTTRLRDSAALARRNEARATTHYQSARDTLRRMLVRLDDRRLAEVPRLRELREALLEDAVAFYEGVQAGLDDPDPAVRLDAALAGVELGTQQYLLGRPGPARSTFRRITAELERLPPDYRVRPDTRTALVQSYSHLANLASTADEAEELFQKARIEAEALVRDDPSDPPRLNTLARVEHTLGHFFHSRGRLEPAEENYRQAVEIRIGLIDRDPANDSFRADLSEDLLNLGVLYQQTNRPEAAATALARAEGLLRPLAAEHPENEQYALSLAGVYVNWGNLLRGSDRREALARYDRAVELADAILAREPEFATARQRAVDAHGARALIREDAGQLVNAVADWDRVVEAANAASQPDYRVGRAVRLVRAGMLTRATAEAHDLCAAPRLTDESRYYLACVLGRLVLPARRGHPLGPLAGFVAAECHAEAAMEQLRRLHAGGAFRNPEYAKALADDSELDALRDRPDFRQLLADVAGSPKR